MIVVAQTMFLVVAACGLMMFLYIHLFSYRRLRHHERRLDRDDARADRQMAGPPEPGTQLAAIGMAPAQAEAALFYLYQEQVRRFIDAKIDIMRSAAETQNRIMVIQAETVRNAAALPGPHMITHLAARTLDISADGDIDVDRAEMVPTVRANAQPLTEQLCTVRSETERHLAEIDEQIRALPGPSLQQWAANLEDQR